MQNSDKKIERTVIITDDKLEGDLVVPSGAQAVVLFAHGSGSSRHSTRNQYVAKVLTDAGFATLLVDLLTLREKEVDEKSRHLRFDIDLLARRLLAVTQWLAQGPETSRLKIGYFGSSTGAAAALIAAAKLNDIVKTIVCRGGRPDLAESKGVLQHITAPTLLIVGGNDDPVIVVNRGALKQLCAEAKELVIIPAAGHLFEEQGKMEEVAQVAVDWFGCYLLRNGRKFENKYDQKIPRLLSFFKEKTRIQVRFKDRAAAGDMLASLLSRYKENKAVTVIGIPRGGAVVADVVAGRLDADFHIVFPRKLRAPENSEDSIGAIMPDGSTYLDTHLVKSMNISEEYIEMEKAEQKKEIERRMDLYRPRLEYRIKDRTVILVDDGAATGATVIAAARWIRKQNPGKLVIAVPVASRQAIEFLKNEADDIQTLISPSDFKTVEQFYDDFGSITDDQITLIVKKYLRT